METGNPAEPPTPEPTDLTAVLRLAVRDGRARRWAGGTPSWGAEMTRPEWLSKPT